MKLLLALSSLLLLLLAGAFADEARNDDDEYYRGYRLVSLACETEAHLNFLHFLQEKYPELDFFSQPALGRDVDLLVSPQFYPFLLEHLRAGDMKHRVVKEDVLPDIRAEFSRLERKRQLKKLGHKLAFDLDDFNGYDDIRDQLTVWKDSCVAGFTCDVTSIGNSFENKPIDKFSIVKTGSSREALWIDGTHHSREWLSPATVLKLLNHFLSEYGSDDDVTRLLDRVDVHIVPVVNPDGYEYSRSGITNRYWRKNRQTNSGSLCIGVDANRNYDVSGRWCREGASTNPCSDIFCGPSAASAPEVAAIQTEVVRLNNLNGVHALVTVHSYGRMILFAWGNTVNFQGGQCERTSDHNDVMIVANAMANAIQQTHNTRWTRGNSCEVIQYGTTGATDEWSYDVGIKYSFTSELRGSDFVINKDQIQPSFKEVFNGVIAMSDKIVQVENSHK